MRIFLAGKMDANGAWRDQIVGGHWCGVHRRIESKWTVCREEMALMDAWPGIRWPDGPNSWVLGLHEYAGPFRIDVPDADWQIRGMFHGSSTPGSHGLTDLESRHHLMAASLSAIGRSDMVFAYINTPDAFGTLVELGYARAMGVFTCLVTDRGAEWDAEDFWFSAAVAHWAVTGRCVGDEPDREEMDEETYWSARPDPPIVTQFKEALVAYTAHPPRPQPVELRNSLAESFANIAHWTSDPRVRGEAKRMLRFIGL
jgi:hypothetical protein